ncbi:MAG TPA: type II toxin-antitoxin system VapC family toxin [Bryobacteraceae bacterium]|nr:type II toxin-antitoxin system VapC family toxin [Bryobacteraceae bacterium]
MRLLLDTNILLWWLTDDLRLSKADRTLITDAAAVFVSPVSAWEIEIKKAIGKLSAPDDLDAAIRRSNLSPLDVTVAHAIAAGRLPRHHRDPFDRMLVAQAAMESLTLVTSDAILKAYQVPVILV